MSLVLHEQHGAGTLLRLNRPEALNALDRATMAALVDAFARFDADPDQRCLVLLGGERAFAAGADIKEMATLGFAEMYGTDYLAGFERLAATRKPWIAGVAGVALGGGCELAMMADILVAGEGARFGQPEIRLGLAPGIGGSQRLTRAIGRPRAMELCLTGRTMDAAEAERAGLVSRLVPTHAVEAEALAIAGTIAAMAPLAALAVKEMVQAADELPLAQGLRLERRLFHALAATEDRGEGIAAFLDKRQPNFRGR